MSTTFIPTEPPQLQHAKNQHNPTMYDAQPTSLDNHSPTITIQQSTSIKLLNHDYKYVYHKHEVSLSKVSCSSNHHNQYPISIIPLAGIISY